jgi:hypothetical protein
MPPRTQGLRQVTPLTRRAELSRTNLPRPATQQLPAGLRPKTPATAGRPQPFPRPVCLLLDARDVCQPDLVRCCQRCGTAKNLERHHRRGKASGGSRWRPHAQCSCNGIILCGPGVGSLDCHHWAHANERRQAEDEGFIVSQAVNFPGSKHVIRFTKAGRDAIMWPSCDGRWLNADEAGGIAA